MSKLICFVDESGTSDKINDSCMGAYIIEEKKLNKFNSEWKSVLEKYDLPYFHMVECAHNNKKFKNLSKNDCSRVLMSLIRIVKRSFIQGFVVSIDVKAEGVLNTALEVQSEYSILADALLGMVKSWADTIGFDGEIEFIFESGDSNQNELVRVFKYIKNNNKNKSIIDGMSFKFAAKADCLGTQAADLLAWQYYTYEKKKTTNKIGRLDFRALTRFPHVAIRVDDATLRLMLSGQARPISDPIHAKENGLFPRDPIDRFHFRSIEQSRNELETILYLRVISEKSDKDTVFIMSNDVPTFIGVDKNMHLSCAGCMRIVCWDTGPRSLFLNFQTNNDRLLINCYWGALLEVSRVIPPFSHIPLMKFPERV